MINEEIRNKLKGKINIDNGILYLLSLYYDLEEDIIPLQIKSKVNSLGIISLDKDNSINWNIPLFEEQEIHFQWVNDFRKLFIDKNIERAGSSKLCIKKMKKFFSLYPHIRKEDILLATENYINSIKDYNYLVKSHNFIYRENNTDDSLLLNYVENIINYENKNRISNNNSMV